MGKISALIRVLRPPFLLATVLSIILGAVIGWVRAGSLDTPLFLLTLAGGVLIHAGTDVANDYFDYLSGNDVVNKEFIPPFTGGSRVVVDGLLTPREVLIESIVLFIIAGLIGVYLALIRGIIIIILGLIGIISGFFYSAPPLKFASRGFGEPLVGLNFGVLLTLGSYYVQLPALVLEPVIISIPVALLITCVLWINEFPDYRADEEVGKRTLVVRIGRKRASVVYASMMMLSYVWIILGILVNYVEPFAILGVLSLPTAILAVRHALKDYDEPVQLAPACPSTILSHHFTTIGLIAAYLVLILGGSGIIFLVFFGGIAATNLALTIKVAMQ